ncbi:MAG: hypothetical protein NZM37_13035, partial [Sandaracinaceae bacterium]|nr:hypothetical protein [Sandaracinaceae bacterium]
MSRRFPPCGGRETLQIQNVVEIATLEQIERLDSVRLGRAWLKESIGIDLFLVSEEGPLPHRRGGVIAASSEVCRVSLFSKKGFERCHAHYQAIGRGEKAGTSICHLGLLCVASGVRTP